MKEAWWRAPRTWPRRRIVGSGVLTSVAATLPAALPVDVDPSIAAPLYVLAVVAAAALGGLLAGLISSVLSFLALNFFFTPPLHTFRVGDPADVVALLVFSAVAVVVGALVSVAIERRSRIERREWEARLLQEMASRLLAGDAVGDVLGRLAGALLDMFKLSRCELSTEATASPVRAARGRYAPEELVCDTISMVSKGVEMGSLLVCTGPDRPRLSDGEREVLKTFADQCALAIESLRFQAQVRHVQIDAEKTQLQAALFSSVTHDLRTPLSSITASVTSLLDAGESFSVADRRALLETIHQEADRLNRLVGNLLDLSRLRADALVPAKQPSDIGEVIESVLHRMHGVLREHDLHTIFRDDLPEVSIDVVQIDQVLTNLLENAAKFSPQGSTIAISASRWHDTVLVKVVDHGMGISPDQRERVFEAFFRGDGRYAGTGLGLAIARAVVVAHGGRMWVEDTPGGGATLAFDVPVG